MLCVRLLITLVGTEK